MPMKKGSFPAIVIIPDDGIMTKAENMFIDDLMQFFASNGIITFYFNNFTSQQKNDILLDLDDDKKIVNIIDAATYIKKYRNVDINNINFLGIGGGSYLALKASKKLSYIRSCILLNIPLTSFIRRINKNNISKIITYLGLNLKQETINNIILTLEQYVKKIINSDENFSFLMSIKTPLKTYKDFLLREIYSSILSSKKPLLMLFGKNSIYFDLKQIKELKKTIKKKHLLAKFEIFNNLTSYTDIETKNKAVNDFYIDDNVKKMLKNWFDNNPLLEKNNQ